MFAVFIMRRRLFCTIAKMNYGASYKVVLIIVTCPAFELLPFCGPVGDLFHGIEAFKFL